MRYQHAVAARDEHIARACRPSPIGHERVPRGTQLRHDRTDHPAPGAVPSPSLGSTGRRSSSCQPSSVSEDTRHLHWQFQTENSGERYYSGYFSVSLVSDLTIESDPHAVAAWIRAQMDVHGTPALHG